jgi:hypothetical protein
MLLNDLLCGFKRSYCWVFPLAVAFNVSGDIAFAGENTVAARTAISVLAGVCGHV